MKGITLARLARGLALLGGLLAFAWAPAIAQATPATTVSLTFDDGSADQYANALPALEAHGLQGTFFINSAHIGGSESMTWQQIKAVATAGNEIGGHTLDHANLASVTTAEDEREICNDRVNLINQGFEPTDFAYPYGAFNSTVKSVVSACGYNSGRALGGVVSPFDGACSSGCPYAETIPPADPLAMRTPDSIMSTTTLSDMQTLVTQAESHGGGWVPIVFHDICENACSARSVSPALFNSFVTWLAEQQTAGAISVKTVKQVVGGSFKPGVSGPPPHGSELLNPSLESAGSSNVPTCWQIAGFGTSSPTFARTNDAHSGSWAEQLSVSNYVSGDAKLVSAQDQGDCAPSATPGRAYTIGTWYKATTSMNLVAFYRDQLGTWHFLAFTTFPASSGWSHAQWTTPVMPSEATAISFGPALASNGSLTFDDLSLEMAPPAVTVVGLKPGNTYAGLTSLTAAPGGGTDHVEFLVNGSVVGTATGAPWTIPWSQQTVPGGPTTIAARAVDATGASSTSSVVVSIDNSGSAIRNSSLEWETGGNSLPDCWEASGFGNNSAVFARTTDAHTGNSAVRIETTSYSSGDRKLLQLQDSGLCAPAVVPGREYTVSSWFKASVKPLFVVFTRNQAGEWKFWTSGPAYTGSQSSWTQASLKLPPIPAGTTNITFGLDMQAVGFLTVDDIAMSCTGLSCDTTAPTSSASASALSASATFNVSYTAADQASGSGLAQVDLYAKGPGQGSYSKVASNTGGAGSGSFSYTAAGGDGTYSFYTVATDAAGNAEAAPGAADTTTLVDTTAPASSASAPVQTASTEISVGYTASDGAGSGLAKVDLYAKAPGQGSYSKVASNTGGAGSGSFSYAAAGGDGTYSFYTVATDAAGNAEAAPATADAATLVDTTAPASSASAPAQSASTEISVGYNASDGSGSGVAKVDLYARAPGQGSYAKVATNTTGAGSATFSYTAAGGDGSYSFYTVATDNLGNAETAPASPDATTLLDTTAPVSSATAPALSAGGALSIGYTASDGAGSGVAKVDLYVQAPGQSSYAKAASDTSGAASGSFSYTPAAGNGTYSFYTVATDRAGNAESAPASADASTLRDTAAPGSSASARALSASTAVTVGYTAADNTGGSGLAKVDLYAKAPGQSSYSKVASNTGSAGSGSFSYTAAAGDGTYSFYTLATDAAGNTESAPAAADATTLVDTTTPVSSASAPGISGGGAVSVGWSASDGSGGSGVAEVDLYVKAPGQSSYAKAAADTSGAASGSFSYTPAAGDGSYSFYTVATDGAGNAESAPATADATTLVDTVAPSSSASAPSLSGSNAITVGYTAADNAGGSGLAEVDLYVKAPGQSAYSKAAADTTGAGSGSFSYTAAGGDGTYSFYTVATDAAGDAETAPASADATTIIDTTAPSSSASAPSVSASGSFSVSFTASDGAGSGIAEVDLYAKAPGQSTYTKVASDTSGAGSGSFSYSTSAGEGTYSFYTVASDKAGNGEGAPASPDTSTSVDTTAPTSAASAPGISGSGAVSVGWSASDGSGGSGVAEVDLYVKAPGQSSYAKAAADTSGAASGSFSYTPAAGDGTYSFYTVATDRAGNAESAPATADAATLVDTVVASSSASAPSLSGSNAITVGYTAADNAGGSGLAEVDLYVKAPGQSSYSKAAADTTGAGSGTFSYTAAGGDGTYSFYTLASDAAGNTEAAPASADATTLVDTTAPTSSAASPATSGALSWSVTYTASDGSGSGLAKVDLYLKAPGQSVYSKIASDTTGAGSGSFSFKPANGDGSYSFYTVATDKAGNVEAAPASADATTAYKHDTTAPTAKASAAAYSRTSAWTVSYTASDNGGGDELASVELWVKPPNAKTYARAATNLGAGLTGSFTYTASAGEGSYVFYVIATDESGNREAAPTTPDASTRYDAAAPTTFAMTGVQYLRATPKLTLASAPTDSGSGMLSVTYQYRVAGSTSAWATACSALTAPWSCAWNTTAGATPDGQYELRATASDKAGNTTLASNAPLSPVTIDNTTPSATKVTTANLGGGTAGKPEAGDTVTFTFSEAMSPTSLLEGWNGTATPVTVKFVAKSAKDTTLAVWNAAGTVQTAVANPLDLGAAYVPSGGATFAASMIESGPAVTVTLGSLSAGGVLAAPATGGTLTWTPNTKATDLAGNKVAATKVTAAGPAF